MDLIAEITRATEDLEQGDVLSAFSIFLSVAYDTLSLLPNSEDSKILNRISLTEDYLRSPNFHAKQIIQNMGVISSYVDRGSYILDMNQHTRNRYLQQKKVIEEVRFQYSKVVKEWVQKHESK
jgi:hypothetical protein